MSLILNGGGKMIKLKVDGRELTLSEIAKEIDNNLLSLEDQVSILLEIINQGLLEDSPRTIRNCALYHQRYGRLKL